MERPGHQFGKLRNGRRAHREAAIVAGYAGHGILAGRLQARPLANVRAEFVGEASAVNFASSSANFFISALHSNIQTGDHAPIDVGKSAAICGNLETSV